MILCFGGGNNHYTRNVNAHVVRRKEKCSRHTCKLSRRETRSSHHGGKANVRPLEHHVTAPDIGKEYSMVA